MKKSRTTILTLGPLLGLSGWFLLRESPQASAPAQPRDSLAAVRLATSYRTAVGESVISVPPAPSRFEQIQAIKSALQPAIKAWERKHARYQQTAGSNGSDALTVELPAADEALVDELRFLAAQQVGPEAGKGMLETLLEQDFAELAGPRKIVALPRAGDGRLDRFEIFIPEPSGVAPGDPTAQAWIMSYSFTMHGTEPPEELRHLLRFAEE
jgi:hypothetical protein